MQFSSVAKFEKRATADALIVPFWKGAKGAQLAAPEVSLKKALAAPLADFKGAEGEVLVAYPSGLKEKRAILIGLGEKKGTTPASFHRAYAAAGSRCLALKITSINVLLPGTEPLRYCVDGLLLSNDSFDELRKEKATLVKKAALIGITPTQLKIAKRAKEISEGVIMARHLICSNADDVTPERLAKEAKGLAKKYTAVKTTVFNRQRIEKEGMGLLLAVSRGSAHDPAFIIASYQGDPKSKDHTVVVGKGVTYDTGGLNLKPTGSMETMRTDMSGAATALGVIRAAAAIKLKANVTAVIASTENCIDAKSYKPGDVYTAYSGKTVEIDNTDAEGRLTLADALAYSADKLKPSRMIDLATLTGAVIIALGEGVAGLMTDDDTIAKKLHASGVETSELLWRLPLHKPYKKLLKSEIADISNCGTRAGSSITAGLFLQEFVKDVPWAHLDIAGTAYPDKPTPMSPNRATGYGVRLLIEFLDRL